MKVLLDKVRDLQVHCFTGDGKLVALVERIDGVGNEEAAHHGQEDEQQDGQHLQEDGVASLTGLGTSCGGVASTPWCSLPPTALSDVHVLVGETTPEEHVEQLLGRHVCLKASTVAVLVCISANKTSKIIHLTNTFVQVSCYPIFKFFENLYANEFFLKQLCKNNSRVNFLPSLVSVVQSVLV